LVHYSDSKLEGLSTISYSKYRPVSLQQILWHKSRQDIQTNKRKLNFASTKQH